MLCPQISRSEARELPKLPLKSFARAARISVAGAGFEAEGCARWRCDLRRVCETEVDREVEGDGGGVVRGGVPVGGRNAFGAEVGLKKGRGVGR